MPLRITTWNVNGIRNPFGYQPWRDKRTFSGMFDILEADIVIMQELKIQRKDLTDDMVLVEGWDCFFSVPKHKKGYSGVGIYTRRSKCAPIRAEEGLLGALCPPNLETPYCELPEDECIGGYPTPTQLKELGVDLDAKALDSEGRCVAVEFPAFVLFGIYSPANSNGLRDDFRHGFVRAMDFRIRNLVKMGKRVVVTGDLNVSREPIDTANALQTLKKEGITIEEYISSPNRRVFNQLLDGGAVVEPRDKGRESSVLWDLCRGFHPTREGMYTHWEQKINARPANFGSRIDFILCSLDMKDWFSESDIQAGLMGSDHCPVYAVIKDTILVDGNCVHLLDLMHPPQTFKDGSRLREFSAQDIPVFSARLFKEFDKRRNIRDMFSRKPSQGAKGSANGSGPTDGPYNLCRSPSFEPLHRSEVAPGLVVGAGHESSKYPSIDTQSRSESDRVPLIRRRSPEFGIATQPAKKVKLTPSSQSSGTIRGQTSVKSFFAPKSTSYVKLANSSKPPITTVPSPRNNLKEPATPTNDGIPAPDSPSLEAISTTQATLLSQPSPNHTNSTLSPAASVHDPIASKDSWDKLFTKRPPPRCEYHDELCKSYKTKIKGQNQGREFWLCQRPLGPTGEKERGTEWRCPTFIWASDWSK